MSDEDIKAHYTDIEVQDLIAELRQADKVKLLKIFSNKGCDRRAGLTPSDVLHNAICEALDLTRPWPKHLNALTYLSQSGRSHISNVADKKSREVSSTIVGEDHDFDSLDSIIDSSPSPQHHIEQTQSSNTITQWIEKIKKIFENDKDAICYIEQKIMEMKKSIILDFCNLSDQMYRNVEKRIKDKVSKKFPNGIPWWEIES